MRPDLEQYYLIDRYLANELNADELLAFELRMNKDTSFANAVSEQKILNNIILEAELKSVREQILHDLPKISGTSFFEKSWKWFGLSALIIVGIAYYAIPSKEPVAIEIEKIIAESNEPVVTTKTDKKRIQEIYTDKTIKTNTSKNIDTVSVSGTISKTNILQTDTTSTIHISAEKISQIVQPTTQQNQSADVKKSDCSATPIAFNVQTQATCSGEEEGTITIDGINGGSKPYRYTLNGSTSVQSYYTNLVSGEYTIKITDKNGCSAEKNITIKEKNCIRQTTKFNINPSIGEVCSIPFAKNKTGNLTVYSRSGMIIYKITNYSDDKIEWNGTDGHGALADPGHYIYIIEYTDGVKESGEVNISR